MLGFLWGDGWVLDDEKKCKYAVRMSSVSDDLDPLLPVFLSVANWYVSRRQRAVNRKPITEISINNKGLVKLLDGCEYKIKSYTGSPHKILSKIPSHLVHYWWRGFFDADGCVYSKGHTNQASFSGSYEQDWTEAEKMLKSILVSATLKRTLVPNGNKYSAIRITSRAGCVALGNYLYQGEQFGLSRKFEKFQEVKRKKPSLPRGIKPTEEQVIEMRHRHSVGQKVPQIIREMDLRTSVSAVHRAIRKETWKHI